MSKKIIGVTVGTPMSPQAVIDKTGHAQDKSIHVTQKEKETWNNKSGFSGNYNDLSDKPEIPKKTSDLENDSNYVTESFVKDYAQPTGDYVTQGKLTEHAREDTHVTPEEKAFWSLKSEFSGNYNDLYGKPTIPTKLSQLAGDAGARTVTDIEKEAWNNKSNFSGSYKDLRDKPEIMESQVLSVNGQTGNVYLSHTDINAEVKGTAENLVGNHNYNSEAHTDIRWSINQTNERIDSILNNVLNSDDVTLDQMSELVEYIKSNRTLIEGITTNKVNVADIIDNLVTDMDTRPLSARQGLVLRRKFEDIVVPTKTSQLTNDSGFATGASVFIVTNNYGTASHSYEKICEHLDLGEAVFMRVNGANIPLTQRTESCVKFEYVFVYNADVDKVTVASYPYRINKGSNNVVNDPITHTHKYITKTSQLENDSNFVNKTELYEALKTIPSQGGGTSSDDTSMIDPKRIPDMYYDDTVSVTVFDTTITTNNSKRVIYLSEDEVPFKLVKENKYKVTWNGTEYDCDVKSSRDSDSSTALESIWIGNASLFGTGEEDTGELFSYMIYYLNGSLSNAIFIGTEKKVTVAVKVEEIQSNVHKIPVKYLPDGVPCIVDGSGELLPEKKLVSDGDQFMFTDIVDLVDGENYKVVWNGVEYSTTCVSSAMDGITFWMLGDQSPINNNATSTGEPFLIIYAPDVYQGTGPTGSVMALDGSESVTMSISGGKKEVHKLDVELLPEGVPYITGGKVEILPEQEIPLIDPDEGMFALEGDYSTAFVAGKTYDITYNGAMYSCIAQDLSAMSEGSVGFGNLAVLEMGEGNDEPFVMMIDGANGIALVPLDGATSVVLKIEANNLQAHKLPNECLDLDWIPKNNYNENILFAEQEIVVESGSSFAGFNQYYLDLDQDTRTKMVDELESLTVVLDGKEIKLSFTTKDNDNVKYFMVSQMAEGDINALKYGIIVNKQSNGNASILLPETGTYNLKLSCVEIKPNPMPEEFMPESVDGIVIRSSTGSGKKFKLTVDDSGTIKATEI